MLRALSAFAALAFAAFAAVVFVSRGEAVRVAPEEAPASASAGAGRSAEAATVVVGQSDYGAILFDGEGRALYVFTRDPGGESVCVDACATSWPPYLALGGLRAGPGARQELLGTIRRREGDLQVTYDGRPLYYFVGDREAGQVTCQGVEEFGGTWLVVGPDGGLVR